jgi:hypothetical protein
MGVEWTIVAGLKQGDTILMQSEPVIKTFSASETSISQIFEIKPSSSGTGSVEVELHAGDKVASVTVFCDVDPAVSASGTTLPFSENKVSISLGHVPGLYNVTFKFTDTDGNSFYMQQSVNVFNNMKTNYWLGGTGLAVVSGGVLTVSDSIMSTAARKVFYVGATGVSDSEGKTVAPSDSNDGSAYSPLENLATAITRVQNAYAGAVDYKIYLYSDQTGAYEINSNGIGSLLIEGEKSGLTINGNGSQSVFNIQTSSPVILKNVSVQGGSADKGGGIYVASGADLTIGEGTSITGNTATITGSQIYVEGKLTVEGDTELPEGECNDNAGMSWAFADGSQFSSAKQAMVTIETEWAKGKKTENKLIVKSGSVMPSISTTNPPITHTNAGLGAFSRVGYTLKGFYSGSDGNGTKYYNADGTGAVTCDLSKATTLYAYWEPVGTVLDGTNNELSSGTYVLSSNVLFTMEGSSGLKISGTVNIYIEEECTLTANGSKGTDASGSISATGGYAGIYLPVTSTLNLYGNGKVAANGGKGGNAAAGLSNKQDAWMKYKVLTGKDHADARGGTGGDGGGGAGGGGAGIGTNGGAGGNGGSGGAGRYETNISDYNKCDPATVPGGDGSAGSSSADCGTINAQSTINLSSVYGGAAGSAGSAGEVLTETGSCQKDEETNYRVNDSGSGFSYDWTAGAGGAGGGGGAGTAGAKIGSGGAGGGGGGGGAGGGINSTGSSVGYKFMGGHGGGGGSSGGGTGKENIDDSSRSSASGGSGGAAGTGGVPITVGTLP